MVINVDEAEETQPGEIIRLLREIHTAVQPVNMRSEDYNKIRRGEIALQIFLIIIESDTTFTPAQVAEAAFQFADAFIGADREKV